MPGENEYAGTGYAGTGDRAALNYRDFSPAVRHELAEHASRNASHYAAEFAKEAKDHRSAAWEDADAAAASAEPVAYSENFGDFGEALQEAVDQTVDFAGHLLRLAAEAVAALTDFDIASMGHDAAGMTPSAEDFALQESARYDADPGAAANALRQQDDRRPETQAAAA